MVFELNDNESLLVEILYPVLNYQAVQKELWQKIRQYSAVSPRALDRIESMLLDGELYGKYQEYACHGAAFYAMGLVHSPFEVGLEDLKRTIEGKLVKAESTRKGEWTLMCFYEQYRQVGKIDFHFAVDLGLDASQRIAFHKPGWGNPSWITHSDNILQLYTDYSAEYWLLTPGVVPNAHCFCTFPKIIQSAQ